MQTGCKVMDVMTNKPVTASRDMPLKDVAALMETQDVNSVLIVENDQPVGIVTDEDIVRKCVAKGLEIKKLKLKDIACMQLITINPGKDIYDALTLMREHNIRQLPVVDKKLVGFLTLKDILKIQPDLIDTWMGNYEIREESKHMKEMEELAEDDGTNGFFSKLGIKTWSKSKKK